MLNFESVNCDGKHINWEFNTLEEVHRLFWSEDCPLPSNDDLIVHAELDGKELIVTVEVPSETPYITCIRDGEQTEGDVYRNPDGSLSLIPWKNNPSGKRFPLFDKDGNPDPLISPKKRKQTLDGKHLGRRNRTRKRTIC